MCLCVHLLPKNCFKTRKNNSVKEKMSYKKKLRKTLWNPIILKSLSPYAFWICCVNEYLSSRHLNHDSTRPERGRPFLSSIKKKKKEKPAVIICRRPVRVMHSSTEAYHYYHTSSATQCKYEGGRLYFPTLYQLASTRKIQDIVFHNKEEVIVSWSLP